jgi:hypothetical protein
MEIIDQMDLYNPYNTLPILVSIVLFCLQTVLALIDANTYIKDSGIADTVISKGKFLYSYIAGYFTYILRLTVQAFSLYILLTIIRIAIVTIFNILRPLTGGGQGADEFRGSLFYKLKVALKNNALWILGFYLLDMFFIAFFVFGPLLILFITIGFAALIYNPQDIKRIDEEEGETEKAMKMLNTVHHQMMFFITLLVVMLIMYIIGVFARKFAAMNPLD